MPAKKIAVWTFKGGVGKTTTSINLAAELARPDGPNKRVALLDFDGQCNLTSMLFPPTDGDNNENVGDEEEAPAQPQFLEGEPLILKDVPKEIVLDGAPYAAKEPKSNAFGALHPYMAGAARVSRKPAPELKAVDHYKGNLLVLQGSTRVAEHEASLGRAILPGQADSVNKLGAFKAICETWEQRHQLDFIVVDLPPSSTALAQVIVTSCDYLLSPVFPDFFSHSSAQAMLTEVLPRWLKWHGQVLEYQKSLRGVDSEDDYFWFKSEPFKILPLMVSNFNIHNKGGAMEKMMQVPPLPLYLTAAHSCWVHSLNRLITDKDIKPIPPEVRALFMPNGGAMVIPFVKDMSAVFTFSQLMRTPIPTLDMEKVRSAGHVMYGKPFDNFVIQLQYAQCKFASLARWLRWLEPRDPIFAGAGGGEGEVPGAPEGGAGGEGAAMQDGPGAMNHSPGGYNGGAHIENAPAQPAPAEPPAMYNNVVAAALQHHLEHPQDLGQPAAEGILGERLGPQRFPTAAAAAAAAAVAAAPSAAAAAAAPAAAPAPLAFAAAPARPAASAPGSSAAQLAPYAQPAAGAHEETAMEVGFGAALAAAEAEPEGREAKRPAGREAFRSYRSFGRCDG